MTSGSRGLRRLWLGTVPYREAWQLQRSLAAARAAGEIGDCLLLLEHPPVYTVGTPRRPHLEMGRRPSAPWGPSASRSIGAAR